MMGDKITGIAKLLGMLLLVGAVFGMSCSSTADCRKYCELPVSIPEIDASLACIDGKCMVVFTKTIWSADGPEIKSWKVAATCHPPASGGGGGGSHTAEPKVVLKEIGESCQANDECVTGYCFKGTCQKKYADIKYEIPEGIVGDYLHIKVWNEGTYEGNVEIIVDGKAKVVKVLPGQKAIVVFKVEPGKVSVRIDGKLYYVDVRPKVEMNEANSTTATNTPVNLEETKVENVTVNTIPTAHVVAVEEKKPGIFKGIAAKLAEMFSFLQNLFI